MKKIFLSFLLFCTLSTSYAKIDIERIDPPFWWTGMQDRELQIMLYGKNIADCKIKIDYPGVTLTKAVSLDSKNYLFLYLSIAPETQPGNFDIQLSRKREKQNIPYALNARTIQGKNRKGFDATDVLYLIMPDRFADGDPSTNVIPSMRFPSPVNRNNPDARHGGDLKGIAEHLDYIEDLGGHLAESGSRKRYARRVVSWICNNRLLSGRSSVRDKHVLPGFDNRMP
jgi:hypothetical protein